MPRLIVPPEDGAMIDLPALVDWCEGPDFDPSCEEGLAAAAPMLRALSRNRDFLADFAIAELKARCAGQRQGNPYSAQVILLHPPTDRYVLRAAFWPAERDHVMRMSGPSAFLYHVPHDHGFDFLTVGYLGPGYASDYYDYDPGGVAGADGEPVALRFVGRSQLSEGRMLLYRANRDIHAQLPAESLSVSLNILASAPGQGWRRQYRFDTVRGVIAQCMTVASAQLLLELAVGCRTGNAIDLAHDFAGHHPEDAMRWTAWRAIGDALPPGEARRAHVERGAGDGSPLIRHASARILRNLRNGQEIPCF
ncbi:transposase [Sphingobium sp. CAP-1]|uniref:transposase n=1 Tax=Sphingobium sp. CAP-1 TaxID=2676077 RepID=UPI0012BB2642|nr:transposase [Sphingobium sp. CAP-1]QGP79043.1 transposase [Sphingobium sp. CAP-1]